MKKWFANKPWKAWRTRKATFVYMMIVSSIAIIYSAVMMQFHIDVSEWLDLVLNFCKFVVGTGTVIVLIPNVESLANFLLAKNAGETIEDEDDSDDEDDDEEAAG